MKELINSFPLQHKRLLLAVSALILTLAIWPTEQATPEKIVVASEYAELTVGEEYPLPLDFTEEEQELAETFTETRQIKIKNGDTLADIFKRVGLAQKTMLEVVRSGEAAKNFTKIIPGKYLKFETDSDNQLLSVSYELDPMSTVIASRDDAEQKFNAEINEKARETRSTYFEGEVTSNFWNAGINAGLDDTLIMNLASIFTWDIDFALDIRAGDRFYALVEQVYIEGEFIGYGDILAAEFVNQGDDFTAVRYTDGRYYTPEGDSMRKAFLRAPVNFKYISSNFTKRRFHPVQKRYKAHRGVDYAASTGTPVVAAGDGKVIKSGYDRFNGHHVFIEHGGGITTKYIHFSKRKVKKGQRVRQGQLIGLVGQTGLAAGPHLHYEFLLNGVHRNPRTVSLPKANPIAKKEKEQFIAFAEERLQQLDHNKQLLLAMR